MNKFFTLKPKNEKELLKAAKPVLAILSSINSLQKKITEIKNKKIFKKTTSDNSKYYQILGIKLGDSAEKIKKVYKKLALKWHPDKPAPSGFTKEQQKEKFQEVSVAANFLLEQEKKEGKQTSSGEIERLEIELKKKEKELQKLGKEKLNEGKRAIRFLLHYNQNLVKYISKGYSSFGGKVDPEELTAEGISSLPKAIEKFDLNSKNCFATYAGYWIKQYIQSYINKNQFINQGSGAKEKKSVIYYDSDYQNDDKESKSYSLLETLHDDENAELTAEQVRHRDAVIQTNNLINSLENREAVLLVRLISKVKPSNLLDIYYLATEEEKKELKKKMKLSDKTSPELLQKYSLEEKKIHSLPLIKKYLSLFTKSYNFSEASKTLGKSENMTRKLKQESFKKLQKLAKERNLHLLIE